VATYCPKFEHEEVVGFYVHVEEDVSKNKARFRGERGKRKKTTALPLLKDWMSDVEQTLKASLLSGFPGIGNLARIHYLSESKLKREFKIRFGKGLFEYYRHLQMELAESYLKEKLCNQKQLAGLLNFSSATNFSICYNKHLKNKAIQERIAELTSTNDERYKTFITQSPFAIAMFDGQLLLKAASQKFISDYGLKDQPLTGVSLYHLLPKLEPKWTKTFKAALKGKTFNGEDLFFGTLVHPAKWMRWDIRPWKLPDGRTGGILLYTEDVTALKLREQENAKILEMLNKASEMIRVGAWKKDFTNNTGFLSAMTREILEVPDTYPSTGRLEIDFYKKGPCRKLMKKLIDEAILMGKPFDVTVDIISAKGNLKRVRVVGYPEFKNGRCERLFGVFQELK
jgi:AraC-like DNA-binding protein